MHTESNYNKKYFFFYMNAENNKINNINIISTKQPLAS